MSYPYYPNNRLIVGGVDLTLEYGLILMDGYTIDPPEPKTYEVDIPGGDGKIDLTETLLGDTAYKKRKMEFELCSIGSENATDFHSIITSVNRFLHGKSFDFKMTMDPKYTYHGRFTVSDISHSMYTIGIAGTLKLTVDADPYKYLDDAVYKIDAVGGKTVYLESGRKRVRPTIDTDGFLKVIHDNKLFTLTQGAWTINDIMFKEGPNEVYFCSYDIRNLRWGELKTNKVSWGDFKKKRLYEWYKSNGDGTYVIETWKNESGKTWRDLSSKKWSDLVYMSSVTQNIKDVYVKYKVGDL